MPCVRTKIQISEEEPEVITVQYTPEGDFMESGASGLPIGGLWFKPSASKFYQLTELNPMNWVEVPIQGNMGNVNFVGAVTVDGDSAITGTRTIGGYRITFKKGLLTGFQAV